MCSAGDTGNGLFGFQERFNLICSFSFMDVSFRRETQPV